MLSPNVLIGEPIQKWIPAPAPRLQWGFAGMTLKGRESNIMEQIDFDVQLRKNTGSARVRQVRRSGLIPGIVYGGNSKPTTIQADRKAYDRIYRQHAGESLIYHLILIDGEKKISDFPAVIKDVQLHPVTDEVIHIDFNRISLDKEIEIKVKVLAKGDAVGVKRDRWGGTLLKSKIHRKQQQSRNKSMLYSKILQTLQRQKPNELLHKILFRDLTRF